MKNLGAISDPKDIITKEYLDEGIGKTVNTLEDNVQMAESDIESLQTDVGTLQTDNTATKAAVKTLQDTYVPNTRKVNGKALDVDIELTAFDVGTQPAEWEWKGDRAYGLVIGTGSGHDVEIGQMTVETTEDSYVAYYYGRYVDNSYIKTSFDSASSYRAVEVSIEPTTDMGIVNKKFLETQLANISIPTKTSQLTNDSGFLTSAPVTSVNSKTGAVKLTASDVGALSLNDGGSVGGGVTFNGSVIINGGVSLNGVLKTDIDLANAHMLKNGTIENVTFKECTLSSDFNTGGYSIAGLPTPTSSSEATNKEYVDGLAIHTVLSTSVPTTAWVTNTNSQATTQEKTDFPFMATISISGMTTNFGVDVLLTYDDQISGNFCSCVYSTSGGVIIEAKEKPTTTITIPVIRYWKS